MYDSYEDILHRHYEENYDPGRYPFERYEMAYTYGFNVAADEPYRDRNWVEMADEIQRGWEEKGAGPWEDFKEAIEYAWDTAKDAMSG